MHFKFFRSRIDTNQFKNPFDISWLGESDWSIIFIIFEYGPQIIFQVAGIS